MFLAANVCESHHAFVHMPGCGTGGSHGPKDEAGFVTGGGARGGVEEEDGADSERLSLR